MKNHWLYMVIGCGLPLLFIFLAPSFGLGDGSSLFIFIIFMFACHFLMPHGSHRHGSHTHRMSDENLDQKKDKVKERNHDHH